jgi:polyvinyl alcohol dehydrogenase (cytochrome)
MRTVVVGPKRRALVLPGGSWHQAAITIGKNPQGKLTANFGDQSANVYAMDAETGKTLWKTKVDEYWRSAITGALALYSGQLFVPISSSEESQVGDPKYPCCKFRGSMVAVDTATGKILWRTYTISEEAHPLEKNSAGTQLWGRPAFRFGIHRRLIQGAISSIRAL